MAVGDDGALDGKPGIDVEIPRFAVHPALREAKQRHPVVAIILRRALSS
jgi:hypothetical protein